MKTVTRFTTLFAVVLSLGFYNLSSGQVLMDENFAYPAGDLITAHGWSAHSGTTDPITVNNGGLTFPGYIDSGLGNAALVDGLGEDDNKAFTPQTSGIVYTSFMVKVTNPCNGYFFHFGLSPITTTFRGKVFMNTTNHFGISVGSNTGTFAASTFTPGTTYLLVVKYEIVAGTNNDKVSLFIFDTTIPASEPVATIGPLTDATMSDINPGTVAIRQFTSTPPCTENVIIDGIRVGKTWADVFPPIPIPTLSQWSLILLGFVLLGAGTFYILRRNG
jgi:hypothetical protein